MGFKVGWKELKVISYKLWEICYGLDASGILWLNKKSLKNLDGIERRYRIIKKNKNVRMKCRYFLLERINSKLQLYRTINVADYWLGQETKIIKKYFILHDYKFYIFNETSNPQPLTRNT